MVACPFRCTLSLGGAHPLALVSLHLARFLSGWLAPATLALAPARTSQILAYHDRSNRFSLHCGTNTLPRPTPQSNPSPPHHAVLSYSVTPLGATLPAKFKPNFCS